MTSQMEGRSKLSTDGSSVPSNAGTTRNARTSTNRSREIVEHLLRYRRHGEKSGTETSAWQISSEEEARQIQDDVAQAISEPVAGWKLGALDEAGQRRLKLSEPFVGRVFESRFWTSPAELRGELLAECRVETEIAVRLAKDLPPRGQPYDGASVATAVCSYHLALELISSSWQSIEHPSGFDIVADNGGCFGLVVGQGVQEKGARESMDQYAELLIDGRIVAEGAVDKPIATLLDRVAWLANHLNSRGLLLEAGQFVATGTWMGMTLLRSGQTARARIAALGVVEMRIA